MREGVLGGAVMFVAGLTLLYVIDLLVRRRERRTS